MSPPLVSAALLICLCLVLSSSTAADQHDPSHLGVTPEEAERIAGETLSVVLQNLIASKSAGSNKEPRSLSSGLECNTLIDFVTIENLVDVYKEELGGLIPDQYYPSAVLFATETLLNFKMEYGLQIYKVCGRCSDLVEAGFDGKGSCQEDDYGYDAMNSGILIAPYDMETGRIVEGTLPVKLFSTVTAFTPTTGGWDRAISNHDPFVLLGTVISSAAKSFVLIPDAFGTGESQDYYRTFMNRRAVASTTVALVWASEMLISRETNCASALSDTYGFFGYSEGAHAAVSAADALHRLGKTIIGVHAGGGGYRVSSSVIKRAVHYCSIGATWFRFYMTQIGAQFHGTVTDLANYNSPAQHWFANDTVAKPLIAAAQIATDDRTLIYSLIPGDSKGTLDTFNHDLFALFLEGVERDIPEPCVTLVSNRTDKICQALQDQDLVNVLEAAPYPVHLCHSSTDQIFSYDNLPNMGANPNLRLSSKEGDHMATFGHCLFDYILFMLRDKNFKKYPVAEKALLRGCDAPQEVRTDKAEEDCFFLFSFFGIC